jgi:hypothetical protein
MVQGRMPFEGVNEIDYAENVETKSVENFDFCSQELKVNFE